MRRKEIPTPTGTGLTPLQSTLQSPDDWAGFLLHRVSAMAKALYETNLAGIGLRPAHVGILQLLATRGPMVQAHLAEQLGIDKAAMVSHLNQLEIARLVQRQNHPDDQRAFLIHLRLEGIEQLSQIETINLASSKELFKGLAPNEQQTLHLLLKRIYDSFL